MLKPRHGVVFFSIGILTALGGALPGTSAARASSSPAAAVAHVWLTTADGTYKLSDQGTVGFSTTPSTVPTVVVDPTLSYQAVQGFGGAITDSSASVLYTLPPDQRAAVMASLFDPTAGDGLDYLRQPVGGSDFVTTAAYTYDDLAAGQTDYGMRDFSIAHDQAQIPCFARPEPSTRGCRSSPRRGARPRG
jgi:glucosylceramidase